MKAASFTRSKEVALTITPYGEGKHFNGYPSGTIEECAKRGVDLLSRGADVTAEAAVAAISLAGGCIERVPAGGDLQITPDLPFYTPVHVHRLSQDMADVAKQIEDLLDEQSEGADGQWYTNFERLRFGVKDDCTEASIYAGVCGGFKRQPPLSLRIGQYNTHPMPHAFEFNSQVQVKRRLMTLVNRYIVLAEQDAEQRLPAHFTRKVFEKSSDR